MSVFREMVDFVRGVQRGVGTENLYFVLGRGINRGVLRLESRAQRIAEKGIG